MTKEAFPSIASDTTTTERTPFSHYYFSNLNVMNEKPTVPSRKIQGLHLSTPSPERKGHNFEEGELCMEHSCPIQYICFTCANSVLCAQCVSNTSHLQHDLKNIERSKQFLKNQLQEWGIRLQFKNSLLNICNDQFRENPAQIFKNAEQYKQKLAELFEQLSQKLQQQLNSIYASIGQFIYEYKNDCQQKKEKIRLKQLEISKMTEINQGKLQHSTVQQQAQYFSEKKQYVESLLEEGQILYYKQQFVEPNWGLDPEVIKNLHINIDRLNVSFKFPEPYRDVREIKEKVGESLKKSIKKSRKELKLPEQQKITQKMERHSSKARNSNAYSINPFFSTFTPKNLSREKKIKTKKSPGDTLLKKRKKSSAKIVSMPASPQKDIQQDMQFSPEKSRKNLFKKK